MTQKEYMEIIAFIDKQIEILERFKEELSKSVPPFEPPYTVTE